MTGRSHRLAGATAWIEARLNEAGLDVRGAPEPVRERAWSTQLRVPTDQGPAWFKANCPAFAFEAPLHALLAELLPDDVDAPLAMHAGRGWLLTRDRGPTLEATRTPTVPDWCELVGTAARMQQRLAGEGDRLLAVGLPDRRPQLLTAQFDGLVEALAGLPADHPSRLTPHDVTALDAARPAVQRAAEVLAASPLPVTLQHGDLHPGNVFATAEGLRLFDFGDAQWAPAVEVLQVPRAVVTELGAGDEVWQQVLAAYRTRWAAGDPDLTPEVMTSYAVHRAGTWLGGLEQATPAELAEWGIAPRHHLLQVLDAAAPAG